MSNPLRPKTLYRLSRGKADRRRVHEFGRALDLGPLRLGDPLLIAWREGKVFGFLSTKQKPLVHVSQLAVAPQAGAKRAVAALTAFRLIEEYERILCHLGLSSYFFHIDREGGPWTHTMEQIAASRDYGIAEYRRVASGIWYQRSLQRQVVTRRGKE